MEVGIFGRRGQHAVQLFDRLLQILQVVFVVVGGAEEEAALRGQNLGQLLAIERRAALLEMLLGLLTRSKRRAVVDRLPVRDLGRR